MNNAFIEANLPRGSIIGQKVVLKQSVVNHAIRFYYSNLWDQKQIEKTLGKDFELLENFILRKSEELSQRIVEKLPPIYIMR